MSGVLLKAGQFLFRYRNMLFPLVLVFAVLACTPRYPFGEPRLEPIFDALGIVVALLGLGVRSLTIGYDYIVRGGRNRQVYADHLVAGGVFAHTRNPMYLGNGLIVLGVALIINAPEFYLVCLPLTAFAYAAIITAEEAYLREKFGPEFDAFCARVNRILPRLSGFRHSIEGMQFDWRRLIVKEYNTIFMTIAGVVIASICDNYVLPGATEPLDFSLLIAVLTPLMVLYVVVWTLKKTRRLETK